MSYCDQILQAWSLTLKFFSFVESSQNHNIFENAVFDWIECSFLWESKTKQKTSTLSRDFFLIVFNPFSLCLYWHLIKTVGHPNQKIIFKRQIRKLWWFFFKYLLSFFTNSFQFWLDIVTHFRIIWKLIQVDSSRSSKSTLLWPCFLLFSCVSINCI